MLIHIVPGPKLAERDAWAWVNEMCVEGQDFSIKIAVHTYSIDFSPYGGDIIETGFCNTLAEAVTKTQEGIDKYQVALDKEYRRRGSNG